MLLPGANRLPVPDRIPNLGHWLGWPRYVDAVTAPSDTARCSRRGGASTEPTTEVQSGFKPRSSCRIAALHCQAFASRRRLTLPAGIQVAERHSVMRLICDPVHSRCHSSR